MLRRVTLLFLLSSLLVFVFSDFIIYSDNEFCKNTVGLTKKTCDNEDCDNEEEEAGDSSEKNISVKELLFNTSYLYTFFHIQKIISCKISNTEKLHFVHFDIETPPPDNT
jgi:hypothetical protein